MPLDPHGCRAYAKRCMELAAETTDPSAHEILLNNAQGWQRLAAKLAGAKELLTPSGDGRDQQVA